MRLSVSRIATYRGDAAVPKKRRSDIIAQPRIATADTPPTVGFGTIYPNSTIKRMGTDTVL
jgi:hypothetical protein